MKKTVIAVLIAVMAVGAIGGIADAKKKKKKPVVPVLGSYVGANNEGIPLTVVITGKTSGTFNYCGEVIPFTIVNKTFTLTSIPLPDATPTSAVGAIGPRTSVLTGTIQPNGCTASITTFTLNPPHPPKKR